MALQESSGLHSLAALHEHENRRIQLRAEASRARAEAEQRARLEAERSAERAESERQRSERAASDSAELARREESTRLDAARAAEFERAERSARSYEALQIELASERGARRSAELGFASQLSRQRLFMLVSSAVCVATWLGTAGWYFGSLRPDAARAQLTAERSLADERRARADVEASSARLLRRNDELAQRVSSLQQAPHDLSTTRPPGPSHGARPTKIGPHAVHGVTISPPPCRDDGDPLNPCLKAH
ncbi:MAG: hypothetical protein ABI488_00280 [Polyangiaceae bacterium]